jgi:carboxyl-terminal processing protease
VKRLLEIALIGLVALLMTLVGSRAALVDEPSQKPSKPSQAPPGLAKLVQSITETVLDHHIDPPARQQMILSGIKALYNAAGAAVPDGLSRRVSSVTTSEQLATLLQDVWPATATGSVAVKELEEVLLDGLLANVSGDAHVVLEKDRKVQEQNEGNRYVGIHIALGMDDGEKRPKMAEVIEGGPADRAGVKRDDLIEQIDGVDTQGMVLRDAVDRLRGEEGTSVTIKVRQPKVANARTYTITRGQHARATIRGRRKRPAGGWDFRLSDSEPIGYLQISEMMGSTPHELRKIARQLDGEGIKALVLDLRRLRTNSVHTAVLLADSLLEHGTIGRVRTSQGETTYQADSDALFRGWPLAVLVDDTTAGASEWLAAALQDNRRAVIVGTLTASARVNPGYGIVTSLIPVNDGEWSVSLATGTLERGNGSPLSLFDRSTRTLIKPPANAAVGVHPDHLIAESAPYQNVSAVDWKPVEKLRTSPDPAETKALELLRQSLKRI